MQSGSEHNKINKTLDTIIKNLSNMVDVNIVIGEPIKNIDTTVIPISKVTVGMLIGAGEYGKVSIFNKDSNLPYSAGNGAIISVKPCGFLIKDNDGYKLISVSDSPYEKLIDKASEFMQKLNEDYEKN